MMNAILARFQDCPALLEMSQSEWFKYSTHEATQILAEIEKDKAPLASDDGFWLDEDEDWRASFRPYKVVNGILHIPVRGVLINNFPWQLGAWATGYEYIRAAIERGVSDDNVTGIALVIESGGGMVSGNWDLVEYIAEMRDVKPMRAIASEYAYSAAYNIAAATSHITVSRTGGLGSIGVIVTHFEYSKALEKSGIAVNFIRSKKDKAEGNPYEALSDGARDRIQADVDELHNQFVSMVALNRSMSESDVDATDAHTFMGAQAVEVGLADAVGNLNTALTAFEGEIQLGDKTMADKVQAKPEAAITEPNSAAIEAARTEGHSAGVAEGAAQATARINAILNSDAGKARPKAALSAALKTTMSAEEAEAFLSDLAVESSVEAPAKGAGVETDRFSAAMDREGGNDVGADASQENLTDDEKQAQKDAQRANAALTSVKGEAKPVK